LFCSDIAVLLFRQFDIPPRIKRVGFEWCNWNRWRFAFADLYVGQVGGPRAKE